MVAFTAEAAKKAIGKVVVDIYGLAKSSVATMYARVHACLNIPNVCKNLQNVRKVKTIYQLEKDVDLKFFYHPSHITTSGKRKQVACLNDIPFDGNLVIEGTVGQGKSTFLRYLTWVEATRGDFIPLFIELRRYDASTTFSSFLINQIKAFGLSLDKAVFEFLLKTGRIALFMDGFDEVADRLRGGLVQDLELLAREFPQTRIVITSRPDSDIQSSELFRVIPLAPLVDSEYKDVIRKMVGSEAHADQLIAQIEEAAAMQLAPSRYGNGSIDRLLTTPLMVALLVVKFKIEQTVPRNLCDFYRDLFTLLLQRHDKTKAGFRRERNSKLADDDLQAVFDGLCFRMRKDGVTSLSHPQFRATLKEVCEAEDIESETGNILKDITSITCLLLDDGGEYRFIHQSVQEFHAARYIHAQPDEIAKVFYETVRDKWTMWLEEINFLSELDDFRFVAYFEIPDIQELLNRLPASRPSMRTRDNLSEFLGELTGESNHSRTTVARWIRTSPQPSWSGYKAFLRCWQPLRKELNRTLASGILSKATAEKHPWFKLILRSYIGGVPMTSVPIVNINDLFVANQLDSKAIELLEQEVETIRGRKEQSKKRVAKKQSRKTVFDFSTPRK